MLIQNNVVSYYVFSQLIAAYTPLSMQEADNHSWPYVLLETVQTGIHPTVGKYKSTGCKLLIHY